MGICPCGSDLEYSICCEPIIRGEKNAETAEALIKAREDILRKHELCVAEKRTSDLIGILQEWKVADDLINNIRISMCKRESERGESII